MILNHGEGVGARVLRGAFFAADEGGNGSSCGGASGETASPADEARAGAGAARQMSEAHETLARRAEAAEARAMAAERNLRAREIASELGLPHGASKFIAGQSEEEMRASAEELRELGVGMSEPARAPGHPSVTDVTPSLKGKEVLHGAVIGAASSPPRAVELPVDDQIAAAYKAGNQAEAIRLKRMKAGLGVAQG